MMTTREVKTPMIVNDLKKRVNHRRDECKETDSLTTYRDLVQERLHVGCLPLNKRVHEGHKLLFPSKPAHKMYNQHYTILSLRKGLNMLNKLAMNNRGN